ncbi:MAG: PIG-L deacetylase family protein [Candidatus Helarchaeota archaeon]
MYETISETELVPALQENAFVPNYFVNISSYIDKKIEIMKIFESELGEHPFPRSEKNIKALATFRGAQSGVEYAETFMILKDIWK